LGITGAFETFLCITIQMHSKKLIFLVIICEFESISVRIWHLWT